MNGNAWVAALAAEHMAALKAQDAFFRVRPMDSDDGEDA